LRLSKKQALTLVTLCLIAFYLTAYTVAVHSLAARYVYEEADGKTWWRTTPSGSLFPWPMEPGMLQALSRMSDSDLLIYRYLIKSYVLLGLVVALWAGVGLFALKRTGG